MTQVILCYQFDGKALLAVENLTRFKAHQVGTSISYASTCASVFDSGNYIVEPNSDQSLFALFTRYFIFHHGLRSLVKNLPVQKKC